MGSRRVPYRKRRHRPIKVASRSICLEVNLDFDMNRNVIIRTAKMARANLRTDRVWGGHEVVQEIFQKELMLRNTTLIECANNPSYIWHGVFGCPYVDELYDVIDGKAVLRKRS